MVSALESKAYAKASGFNRFVFFLGYVSFLNLGYWFVRLIVYLVVKERPLKERLNSYFTQQLVFGYIAFVTICFVVLGALTYFA